MNSIHTLVDHIKKPKYLFILGLIIMVVAIFMLRTLTPLAPIEKSDLTQSNFDHSTSTFQLKFSGDVPTLPKNLPVGAVTITTTSEKELLQTIIKQFELELDASDPFIWTGPDYILVKDEGSNMYTMAKKQPANRSARLDESAITVKAEALVEQLFPQTQLGLVRSDTRYLAGSEEQREVSLNQAELIELVFAPTFNNFPMLIKNNSQSLVQVEYDSDQQLVKLTFLADVANLTLSSNQGQELAVLTIDQAIKNLNRGDGAVITADSPQVSKINLNTQLTGNLQKVEIEYRSNDKNQLLPYLRFSGSIQANGITLQADIITPAIDQKAIPSS